MSGSTADSRRFETEEARMKRQVVLAAVGIASLLALAAAPAAAGTLLNVSVPTTLTVFVPCANGGTGENVDVSGNLHILLSETINANRVSGTEHFQPQGISGVGELDGVKYQATGVTDTTFSGSLTNGQFQETFINRFDFIGQGPGNNMLVHETLHITFNANGAVTVFFDNFSLTCK